MIHLVPSCLYLLHYRDFFGMLPHVPVSWSISLCFPLIGLEYQISGHLFYSFELIIIEDERRWSYFSFPHLKLQPSCTICQSDYMFSKVCFWQLCQKLYDCTRMYCISRLFHVIQLHACFVLVIFCFWAMFLEYNLKPGMLAPFFVFI